MILINLLPHRELARKKARQVFNTSLAGAAVLGALVAGGVYLWFQNEISRQQERNGFLTSEIKKLDEEIKEVATLQARFKEATEAGGFTVYTTGGDYFVDVLSTGAGSTVNYYAAQDTMPAKRRLAALATCL